MRAGSPLGASLLLVAAIVGSASPTFDPPPPPPSIAEILLGPGDTLEGVLLRSQVGRGEIAAIIGALTADVDMRRLRPGERLRIASAPDGRVLGVTYWRTPVERYEVRPDGVGWNARKVLAPIDTRLVAVRGSLERSLFESMDRLEESPVLPAEFVNLFEWDFDFAAGSQAGDKFRLLVEKRFVGGELVGYGDIWIAQYRSVTGRTSTAVAFRGVGGTVDYFDAEGRSVRKMFLRAPLDFTRVTSGYSHARRHPILGGLHPHLAVDYGAPPGTPVRAVADGVTQAAGWRGGFGLSVTLRHALGYRTMYNHLSKVGVRPGQRVHQRQVIGRVGSTGLSSGPHLDYRVIRDGRFVNPLAEKFVPGSPVPPSRREAFQRHLGTLLERLDREAPFEGT